MTSFTGLAEHNIVLAPDLAIVPEAVLRRAHARVALPVATQPVAVLELVDHVLHGLAVDPRTLAA
jgi:hypothetical protein